MSDEWKTIPPIRAMEPPYDGETYLVQTEGGTEFEARYDDPETPETGTDDMTVHRGSWCRIDGNPMPENDPPAKWKPRRLDGLPGGTRP